LESVFGRGIVKDPPTAFVIFCIKSKRESIYNWESMIAIIIFEPTPSAKAPMGKGDHPSREGNISVWTGIRPTWKNSTDALENIKEAVFSTTRFI